MNGIIVINKPLGKTSHDMVYFMRRLTNIIKVGHTGTLHPGASGVLPMCIGNATKAADMLTLSDKRYTAELILGMTTDTQDAEGEVLTECAVNLTAEEIEAAIKSFIGEIEQTPPMYSAVKQNGKKLYELARKGIEVERKKRKVAIREINILEIDTENYRVKIDVVCSKGTYIRTLCEDIGARLGVGAYMNTLIRTRTGPFELADSYTVGELTEMSADGTLENALIPVDRMFEEYPAIRLNEKQTRSITNGIRMSYRGEENKSYRLYDENGGFLCISKCVEGKLVLEKSFWN
ncbi:MAG: tRNA pseudouridine(55) synthase TruB [Oscillospiraceae bacterium]|nr:tRNA pseudouridine(55) synthase TruB [Oscillospiraceae bacterium]